MSANVQGTAPAVPRRGYAMILMIVSSVIISFGGLVVRNIELADAWQINLYRSLALMVAITAILFIQYRSKTVKELRGIGYAGVWAGAILALAGMTFMQALHNTTVAKTMFMLSAIPFFTAGLAWLFLREGLSRITVIAMVTTALGIVIMVMDSAGHPVVVANLNLNYHKPVPLGEEVEVWGQVTMVEEGEKVVRAAGEIRLADGHTAVSAAGLFVRAPRFFENSGFLSTLNMGT